jgi:hypothetical protein
MGRGPLSNTSCNSCDSWFGVAALEQTCNGFLRSSSAYSLHKAWAVLYFVSQGVFVVLSACERQ